MASLTACTDGTAMSAVENIITTIQPFNTRKSIMYCNDGNDNMDNNNDVDMRNDDNHNNDDDNGDGVSYGNAADATDGNKNDGEPTFAMSWVKAFEDAEEIGKNHALDLLLQRMSRHELVLLRARMEPFMRRDFVMLLPDELATHILSLLDARSLLNASQVSRGWNRLSNDYHVWKTKCQDVLDVLYSLGLRLFGDAVPDVGDYVSCNSDGRHSLCTAAHWSGSNKMARSDGSSRSVPSSIEWKEIFQTYYDMQRNWATGKVSSERVLQCHDEHVITCLQMDDQYVVSASDDCTIMVWNIQTGSLIHHMKGHSGGVWCCRYNGRYIISGSTDRTLKVWSMKSGEIVHTLVGHVSTVRCLQLKGAVAVTGSRDSTLRIWDIEAGICLHVMQGHTEPVRCVAFDGEKVVSGSYDFTARIWDASSGSLLHVLAGHNSKIYSLEFDGNIVVTGSLDTTVRVWDAHTGTCLHELMGHGSLVGLMQLCGNVLLSGNADSTMKIWNICTGELLHTLRGHDRPIRCCQLMGGRVLSGSDDGRVKMWDLKTGMFIRDIFQLDVTGVVWRLECTATKLVVAVSGGVSELDLNGNSIFENSGTRLKVLDFSSVLNLKRSDTISYDEDIVLGKEDRTHASTRINDVSVLALGSRNSDIDVDLDGNRPIDDLVYDDLDEVVDDIRMLHNSADNGSYSNNVQRSHEGGNHMRMHTRRSSGQRVGRKRANLQRRSRQQSRENTESTKSVTAIVLLDDADTVMVDCERLKDEAGPAGRTRSSRNSQSKFDHIY